VKAAGATDAAIIVCGNKVDLKGREVTANDANKWCATRGYTYFDVSASNGDNVVEAFDTLFNMVVSRALEKKRSYLSNRG
jgi:hypothetical protein